MTNLDPAFDFTPGLPLEQLQAELALGTQLTCLGKRKTARYLFEMHERRIQCSCW